MLATAATLPALPRPACAQAAFPSLKEAATAAGLVFGSDSDTPIATAPAPYAALFARQCDLVAPLLYWGVVSHAPGDAEPAWEDPNIGFARSHGMRLTGGHFVWHESTPDWFAAVEPGAPAQAAIDRHILALGRHYAGQVFAWNVVNEAIDTRNGTPDGLRRSVYLDKLGPAYIAAAFRTAREADKRALLLYNDYGLEMDTSLDAARREALMRLLDRLQRDAPIDGVGLQSHLRLDDARFNPALYARFLRDIARRGLKILITELDVLDIRGGPDIAARDADVAAQYRDFLGVTLAEPAVKSLVTWGLSDRYTWLTGARSPYFSRPDKLPARPLPFDDALQPKPAFYAVLKALQQAPKRIPA